MSYKDIKAQCFLLNSLIIKQLLIEYKGIYQHEKLQTQFFHIEQKYLLNNFAYI